MGESMLPEAFLERMQQMLGEEYGDFLETFAQEKYQALRMNVLKFRADRMLGTADRQTEETKGIPEGADRIFPAWQPQLSKVPWAENGYYYGAEDAPGRHPYHDAGLYYIQEPSAMAPAEFLAAQPGERVLDLCAAPGGKSTQIAAGMRGDGILFCNEINSARAKILSENIERMGICNACVLNETPERLAECFPEYFDRILVDAPCSGEGMFRKNDAACEEWSPENVAMCAHRQDGILDCAARMLRPGGRLVYSTCTFAPEENEGSISRFVRRHEEFRIVNISAAEKERLGLAGCDGRAEYIDDPVPGLEGTLRLWPQRIKGEGHYAAVLQKAEGQWPESRNQNREGQRPGSRNQNTEGQRPGSQNQNIQEEQRGCGNQKAEKRQTGYQKQSAWGLAEGIIRKIPEDLARFVCDNLRSSAAGEKEGCKRQVGKGDLVQSDMEGMLYALGGMTGLAGKPQMIGFGDHLYLIAEGMPSLKGLKVLRPGLHLGELRKNRFEPSHALALALHPSRAVHTWNLDSGGQTIRAYLNGETFPAEGEKGWYLICVDGFGIGWGKLAGGVMKNHYPRGLRGKNR